MNKPRFKGILIFLVVIGLGILVCPNPPTKDRVDPFVLIEKALASESSIRYKAKTKHTAVYNGKTVNFTFVSDITDSGSGVTIGDKTFGIRMDDKNRQTVAVLNALIKQNFEPLVEGEDIIAGRPVWTLRLKPKQKIYPWKQLWIDKKTYHVIASRDWNCSNNIKRSMRTLSITHKDVISDNNLPQYASPKAHSLKAMAAFKRKFGEISSNPRYIPTGFILWDIDIYNEFGDTCLSYTDGLNTISIIVGSHIFNDNKWNRLVKLGMQNSGQASVLCKNTAGKRIIVIADLPENELQKIAASL